MRWLLVILVALHGVVHFLGFAKSFGLAELPQLSQPITRGLGLLWFATGLAFLLVSVLITIGFRHWWILAITGVFVSQLLVVAAWSDARYATIVNVLILLAALYGFVSNGPSSFEAEYLRKVRERLESNRGGSRLVTQGDIDSVPTMIGDYLRFTGMVGKPAIHHFRAAWEGRIRSGPDSPWMPFTAEQYNFTDEPARFFHMRATRAGLPVDVFHSFEDGSARMRVKLLSVFPLVDASGPELSRAETVTLFNDSCILAPTSLLDSRVRWGTAEAGSLEGSYSAGPNDVAATLEFGPDGRLVDFVSDDRLVLSADGQHFDAQRWSTPLTSYRSFSGLRLPATAAALWHPPSGPYTYLELALTDFEANPAAPSRWTGR